MMQKNNNSSKQERGSTKAAPDAGQTKGHSKPGAGGTQAGPPPPPKPKK